MRVGIATFFPNNNYGCLLQAFALQQKVESLGFDAEIIAFEPSYKYLSTIKNFFDFPHLIVGMYRYIQRHQAIKHFASDSRIKSTKIYKTIKELNQLDYDILIAGSDQIWHSEALAQRSGGSDYYFLNFGSNIKKKISYAASISQKKWPKDFEIKGIDYLKKIDNISVREQSATQYLNSIGFHNVATVCDPTLLHNGDFYIQLFAIVKNISNNPFLFRIRENIPQSITPLLKDRYTDVFMEKKGKKPSITQWLSYIYNASFIVTDSFHCTVFCILFHKPFVVIPNQANGIGMNERFATLLGATELEYRCLTNTQSSNKILDIINTPVNWSNIDSILNKWKAYSVNWLKTALYEIKT